MPRTSSAASRSRLRSASSAEAICDSTMVAIRSNDSRRLASSVSNVMRVMGLAEAAGDVVLSPLVAGPVEELGGGGELDELAVSLLGVHEHEGGEVGHSRSLLHVVGDDHDGVLLGQLNHEV